MTARKSKRGNIRYYYGQEKIPLGGCFLKAMQRWSNLEAGMAPFDNEGLLRMEDILCMAIPKASIQPRVYFLIANNQIVYVGKTKNLFKRLEEHKRYRDGAFDSYAWLPCEEADAATLETRYISALRPQLNLKQLGTNP